MIYNEDTSIYPVFIGLLSCLEQALADQGTPPLCYIGPMEGNIVLDHCGGTDGCSDGCGGQAWVRLVDAFPSAEFPALDALPRNCKSPYAFTLQVGVARCSPMGMQTANGWTPPAYEDRLEAIRLQTADIAAMRRAIHCCFGSGDRDYLIGMYDQTEVVGGGCIGGTFNVIVWEDF